MSCYHCEDFVEADKAIGCSGCKKWAHRKCVYMEKVGKNDLQHVNWICTPCLDTLKFYLREGKSINKKLDTYCKAVEEKLDDVVSKVESVQTMMTKVEKIADQPTLSPPQFSPPTSYANVTKKHLLVVKSTDNTQKATDKKDVISVALKDLQIADTKFRHSGNVILNFETEELRDRAADVVGDLDNLSATKTKKLLPRIMICNVNTMESKADLVQTIISKNEYLQTVKDIDKKIDLIFEKNAKGGTIHYILKCHPEVRGLIFKNGDYVKLNWTVSKVRDRFYATMCYHCLSYGHVHARCPNSDKEPCCKKCAGNHSARECSSTEKKCLNCGRAGKTDTDHEANEMGCPILMAEIAKIRNKTDHGY